MRVLTAETVGEAIPVGDEEHLDLRVERAADDLAADFGSFPFVGAGEGLVEQDQATRCDPPAMTLIRRSSSSSRPLVMSVSSSRMKWVKIPQVTFAW